MGLRNEIEKPPIAKSNRGFVCYITNLVKVGNGFIRFLTIFALGFIFSQLIFMLVSMFTNITYSSGLITLFSLGSTFLATLYLFSDESLRTNLSFF